MSALSRSKRRRPVIVGGPPRAGPSPSPPLASVRAANCRSDTDVVGGAEEEGEDGAGGGEEEEEGAAADAPRRKRQTLALREIRKYQQTTELLITKASFERVVRDVAKAFTGDKVVFEWAPAAFVALQEAAEAYLVGLFADAQVCAVCRKGKELTVADVQQARRVRGIGRC